MQRHAIHPLTLYLYIIIIISHLLGKVFVILRLLPLYAAALLKNNIIDPHIPAVGNDGQFPLVVEAWLDLDTNALDRC